MFKVDHVNISSVSSVKVKQGDHKLDGGGGLCFHEVIVWWVAGISRENWRMLACFLLFSSSPSSPSSGGWGHALDVEYFFKQRVKCSLSEQGSASNIQRSTLLLCCLIPPCFWVAEWGGLCWFLECAARRGESVDGYSWCNKTGEEVLRTARLSGCCFYLDYVRVQEKWLHCGSPWGLWGSRRVCCTGSVTYHQLLGEQPRITNLETGSQIRTLGLSSVFAYWTCLHRTSLFSCLILPRSPGNKRKDCSVGCSFRSVTRICRVIHTMHS